MSQFNKFIPFNAGEGLLAKCFDYFFEMDEFQRTISEDISAVGVILYPDIVEGLFNFDLSESSYQNNFNAKVRYY